MKKWWLLPVLAVFLAACGNDEEATPAENEDLSVDEIAPDVEDQAESTEPEEAEPTTEEAPEEESTGEESKASYDPGNANLLEHEESEVLAEHIPLDELTAQVEADNEGKRIILFEDKDGKKVYKSILIKHDNHLKIIDLNGDELLFEGKL